VPRVVADFYTGLEEQDTSLLCRSITPSAREKVIAIGAIKDAKTCPQGYEKIFEQVRFHYTDPPKVLRVTISGNRAHATTAFGGETTRAPLRKVSGEWKVDSIG
jgi:hypothetical protein